MKRLSLITICILFIFSACQYDEQKKTESGSETTAANYFDNTGRDDILTGGVKMIPIQTSAGEFKVWTKRTGNNPNIKVLILHGGPGASHQYLECFDSFFPGAGIEYYYYDQLESVRSDQPGDTSLWHLDRFVEEVEQVRVALGLNKDNFYLYGQSWGGILAIDYALRYQDNMKALIISNMVSSIPDYVKYADEVLGPQLDPEVLSRIKELEANDDFLNPEYTELVSNHYYPEHILRMPLDEWPEPVVRDFEQTNVEFYTAMQGPSEFGCAGNPRLEFWDRNDDLSKIKVPTLTIGAKYDTMDPEHMKWMASEVQHGRYLYCPEGSHLAMYDDQETYFEGLIRFIKDVDAGDFPE
ncbi:MAG: proline iminopeptidase-family hydrolase [Bacteroidales bacterium]|jgi:proline iminopeptidase|nr:proline iminopeptidase-family hydrolase [Bacteroidales bacterium]